MLLLGLCICYLKVIRWFCFGILVLGYSMFCRKLVYSSVRVRFRVRLVMISMVGLGLVCSWC